MFNGQFAVGFLGADATVKDFDSGTSKIAFRIATDTRQLVNGEPTKVAQWFNVETFVKENHAGFFRDNLKSGQLVLVFGELKTRTYVDQGEDRHFTYIDAHSSYVRILRNGNKESGKPRSENQHRNDDDHQPARRESGQQQNQRPAQPSAKPVSQPTAPAALDRNDLMSFDD